MTYQLAFKRKFVNGTSDFQGIGLRDKESSITVDGDQFVVGSKSFVAPTRFYSDISVGGKYYGDGSQLTNLSIPIPTLDEVCISGNTASTNITLTDVNPAITAVLSTGLLSMSDTSSDSYGKFARTYLQFEEGNGNLNTQSSAQIKLEGSGSTNTQTASLITMDNGSNNTTIIQPLAVDLSVDGGPQTTQLRIDYLRFTDDNTLDGTICHVGAIVDNSAAGLLVNTGNNVGQPCHVLAGFEGSAGQEPKLQLRNASAGAIVEVKHTEFRVQSDQLSYRFYNDTKIFKWDAGTSYRVRPNDGSKINADDDIVVSNNIGNFDFKNYTEYLDANGQGGFMVYICNPGNLPDPFISSPDIYFVGGQIGGMQNAFSLPKWTSARFILTPTDPACGYPYDFIWLVSW